MTGGGPLLVALYPDEGAAIGLPFGPTTNHEFDALMLSTLITPDEPDAADVDSDLEPSDGCWLDWVIVAIVAACAVTVELLSA